MILEHHEKLFHQLVVLQSKSDCLYCVTRITIPCNHNCVVINVFNITKVYENYLDKIFNDTYRRTHTPAERMLYRQPYLKKFSKYDIK